MLFGSVARRPRRRVTLAAGATALAAAGLTLALTVPASAGGPTAGASGPGVDGSHHPCFARRSRRERDRKPQRQEPVPLRVPAGRRRREHAAAAR